MLSSPRAVGVAGDAGAAAVALGYGVVQLPLPVPGGDADALAPARAGQGVIVRSVFGPRETLARRMARDEALAAHVRTAGRGDAARGLGRLLLDRAFALNPDGVVLATMMSQGKLTANFEAAEATPAADRLGLLLKHQ
jgi:hypothetical protein